MSIKKQLAAFYAKQGLTGKHRRKAMQYDMKAVNTAIRTQSVRYRCPYLSGAFSFKKTVEGHRYWAVRAY